MLFLFCLCISKKHSTKNVPIMGEDYLVDQSVSDGLKATTS